MLERTFKKENRNNNNNQTNNTDDPLTPRRTNERKQTHTASVYIRNIPFILLWHFV